MPQLTRQEIIAKYKKAKMQKHAIHHKVGAQRRPSVRKTLNLYVKTDIDIAEVNKEYRRVLSTCRTNWKSQPLLSKIVPYFQDSDGLNLRENEGKIVVWVERGIHPFSRIRYGMAAERSAFDYMNEAQLSAATELVHI